MKFFYINNRQCTDCNRCMEACPTSAIYSSGEKRYINYDKCTSCGSCVKICSAGAITVETIERITLEMEKTDLYKSRIQRLESEVSALKQHVDSLESVLSEAILHLPVATFVADKNNRIHVANAALVEMLDADPLIRDQWAENLAGEYLKDVFPDEVMRLLQVAAEDDREQTYVTLVGGRSVSLSFSALGMGAWIGVLRDVHDPVVEGEEIVRRLRETIDRKLAMVQQIGFLLGEEVSVVVNNLNSVIRMVEASAVEDPAPGEAKSAGVAADDIQEPTPEKKSVTAGDAGQDFLQNPRDSSIGNGADKPVKTSGK